MASNRAKSGGRTVGVDSGGTFTDLVAVEGDSVRVKKRPSVPADPGAAVAAGLADLGGAERVVHGTTVALNALLTGRLARTAFVTNRGFADVLEIARQDRPDLYALEPRKPAPLVPRELCFEVDERTWPDPTSGELQRQRRPSATELAELAARVAAAAPESIAIGLLHSYGAPEIEREVADALRSLGVPITLSADLLPEHREVERYSTAAVNAALRPLMERYLGELEARLSGARLQILRSSGGFVGAARAAREPVRILLSGPAGGVLGATDAAREVGLARVLTLDLGGTSTDVAFGRVDGTRADAFAIELPKLAGHTIGVPTLDVHTIGCGGGSLVRVGSGGALEVGPESAAAAPGPACYDGGGPATLTDAHLLLGQLATGAFLGGELALDVGAARRAFEPLAARLGATVETTARAALQTAQAAMVRALRVMSSQRGLDPADLPIVAFGGGGGLHGADLAAHLGGDLAVVPRHPGVLSALGLARAAPEADASASVLEPLPRWGARRLAAAFVELEAVARAELAEEGVAGPFERRRELDLCYRGQSFELRLPNGPGLAQAFHRAHQTLFGYALPEREVLVVALRVRLAARARPRPLPAAPRTKTAPAAARLGRAAVDFGRGPVATTTWERERLPAGAVVPGPARIEEYSGTTLVPPGWGAQVGRGGHLLLRRDRGGALSKGRSRV
ncbi:MAG: hydantoinase/oxoprolinase family protein [Planctomycetaceae bacterium]|nr:hydantoinase/oxoprolinase family protein [Planctomycetaceae bacterium]